MTDESNGESSLLESGSVFEPVESSVTLTDSSDDGVVVPAKVRHTRLCSSVVEVQEPRGSRMEQGASASAAHHSGKRKHQRPSTSWS